MEVDEEESVDAKPRADRQFRPRFTLRLVSEGRVGGMADGAARPGRDRPPGQGLPAEVLLGQSLERESFPVGFPHGASIASGPGRAYRRRREHRGSRAAIPGENPR